MQGCVGGKDHINVSSSRPRHINVAGKLCKLRVDDRTGKLFLRPTIHLPNGRTLRPYVSAGAWGLPDTPKGVAEAAEREIARAHAEHAAAGGALSTVNPNPNPIPTATPVVAAPTATPVKEVPTLAAYLPTWFANGQAKGNKRQTLRAMRQFQNIVTARLGALRLDEITAAVFRDWRNEMHTRGLAPGTINGRLVQLASVLRLAIIDEWIAAVPAFGRVKADRAEVAYFTPEEVIRLIDGANTVGLPMIATLIDIASRTGLRIGELRALTWDDVNLATGEVTIRRNVARGQLDTPKSRKARVLPLSPDAIPLFQSHKATVAGAYVFPGERADRISDGALRYGFNAACAAAGVARPTSIKACNAWHLLRHSFATEMARTVEHQALSRLMGHGGGAGDLRVTQRYIHASNDDMRRAMQHADIGRRTVTPTPPPTSPQTEAPIEIAPRLAA